MIGTYLKKKFGKDKEVPAAEQFYSPLRIGLHSTIEIDTVDWLIMQSGLNESMSIPTSNLSVLAIGEIDTDGDSIYHVYLEDNDNNEFILQLYCMDKAGAKEVTEATLFKQVVNIVPSSEGKWEDNLKLIGDNTIELDGNIYQRVWGDEHEDRIDLVEFKEQVIQHNKTTQYTDSYLLYSRVFTSPTGAEETEMLLAGVEETEESAEITMMLGLTVPLQNINIQ